MKAIDPDCSYVCARAPLRLGLAGGGTDVSPYCDIYGGRILNATISYYAYAMIKLHSSSKLVFNAADQDKSETLDPVLPLGLEKSEGGLLLHRGVYNAIISRYNNGKVIPMELTTFSDVPQGSGLGASSTLTVAMIKSFVELLNLPLDEYDIAQLGYTIERGDCGLQGGRQDHYSASFGGLNYLEFRKEMNPTVYPLRIKNWITCDLESSLLLYYSGVSRDSDSIIAEQSSLVGKGDGEAIDAMHRMREEAPLMKQCLLRGDFDGLIDSMRNGWDAKKRSASMISNSFIEEIYRTAIDAGALAGKVSGAGGGGFMLFFVPQARRMAVTKALQKHGGFIMPCAFSQHGAQAWRR